MIYGFELLFFVRVQISVISLANLNSVLFFFFQVEMDNERIFETMVYKVKVMEH